MSTTVRVNSIVQFTLFLVMRLNITIVTSCNSHFVILAILAWKWTEERVRNVVRIKYGFAKLVVILLLLIQDVIMSFLLIVTPTSFSLSLFSISSSFIFMAMEAVAVVSRWHLSGFAFIWLLENQPKSFDDDFSGELKTLSNLSPDTNEVLSSG